MNVGDNIKLSELAAKLRLTMTSLQQAFRNMHPALKIIFICCIIIAGMGLAVYTGTFLSHSICGTSSELNLMLLDMQNINNDVSRCANLLINSLNQIMAFGLAALVFSLLYGSSQGIGLYRGNGISKTPQMPHFIVGAIILTFTFSPFLDLTFQLNEWLLVEGSTIHTMALALEEKATEITIAMLQMETVNSFIATLVAVAILPAICEEYLFRGTLQPIIAKWSGNIHVGIWVSAAIFSAIHLQFFGFLPRMLLGAGFGYLVVASGSLWPSILGHFVNNGLAVAAAWLLGADWIEEGLQPSSSDWGWVDWSGALLSLIILVVGIRKMKSISIWAIAKPKYLETGRQKPEYF